MSKANNTSKSLSINQRRWKKFKGMRRGYYSMIILLRPTHFRSSFH
ncbi:MAG: hypothetical protein IPP80_01645 [Ignavibacteria bacterium]|nr:hypothetical protein [Ignavibacteria bacterium]